MRRWLASSAAALHRHEDQLNCLNVFPVADSDTGTNLALTLDAGATAATMINTSLIGELFQICAHHCLEEAKGNSGTLFAVMLAGMADPLADQQRLTVLGLTQALEHGRVRVRSALNDPVDGTILSVVDAITSAARQWQDPEDSNRNLAELLVHLVDAATEEVGRSGEVLPVLRGTGQVDAGALGCLIIIDCLAHTVRGRHYPGAENRPYGEWLGTAAPPFRAPRGRRLPESDLSEGGVEFMCSIELDALTAARVRHELARVGESVIMTAMTPAAETIRWKVHVHVPEAATAMSVLSEHGKPAGITTEPLTAGRG